MILYVLDLLGVAVFALSGALAAGRAGIVREVLVQEGMSVEAGRPLVVVE